MRLNDFESHRLDELAPATLASYKTKAGAAATAADAAGDVKTADKRFSGIVKATKKQFDQDAKGVAEGLGKQIHGTFQSMGDSFSDAHLAKGISYFLQGRHQEGENWLRGKIPEKAQHAVFSKLKTLQAQPGVDINKNPNIQKYIDDKLVPWVKSQIQQGVSEGKADYNFDIEDLKRLERIRDLPTLKTQAMMLISKPSAKPMRPEKVEWFKNALERMTSPMAVIKLMYDLLLSGEGYAVVGSKSSMNPNSYRQRFNEQDATEDALAGMKRLAGIATVPAQTTPGLRQYRHMPTAVQPR